jgi:hypothetical protein
MIPKSESRTHKTGDKPAGGRKGLTEDTAWSMTVMADYDAITIRSNYDYNTITADTDTNYDNNTIRLRQDYDRLID